MYRTIGQSASEQILAQSALQQKQAPQGGGFMELPLQQVSPMAMQMQGMQDQRNMLQQVPQMMQQQLPAQQQQLQIQLIQEQVSPPAVSETMQRPIEGTTEVQQLAAAVPAARPAAHRSGPFGLYFMGMNPPGTSVHGRGKRTGINFRQSYRATPFNAEFGGMGQTFNPYR